MSLLPLILLLPPALAGAVEDRDTDPAPLVVTLPMSALEPLPDAPMRPPADLLPTRLRVGLVPGDETALTLDLELEVLRAGPVALPVSDAALAVGVATLDGRPVAVPPGPDGRRLLVAELGLGLHRLHLVGTVATPRPELDLALLPAARARVVVQGDWQLQSDTGIPAGGGAIDLPSVDHVHLSWRPPTPPTPWPMLILARAATALQVDATGVQARSQVRFTVLHGTTDTLWLRLPAVEDLQVEGPAVTGFSRQGDRVRVTLARPVDGAVDLSLSYRAAAPSASGAAAPLPAPETTSGRLEEGWVSVLAGDQGTVIPDLGRGVEAVPGNTLPEWARGLVPGSMVASMAVTGPNPDLSLRVLDLSAAEAPGTFVDEARIEVAHAAHGRALMRLRYQVRNDRNQYLGLLLPPGARPLGVRVAGTVVQTVRSTGPDGDRLYIPLQKSVETLTGLVTFPVEIALLVDEAPWDRRGTRQLQAPAVDAPVAFAHWELVLPPGMEERRIEGSPTVVVAGAPVGQTLEFGRATGMGDQPTLAAEDEDERRREQSQDAWNQAYKAYQDNRFDEAKDKLAESLSWNQDNAAAQALMDNVQVLVGDNQQQDDAQARRIRSLARAKTQGLEAVQTQKQDEVNQAVRAGDYDKAEEKLSELEVLTEQLAAVEDTEVVDQKVTLDQTRRQLAEVKAEVSKKEAANQVLTRAPSQESEGRYRSSNSNGVMDGDLAGDELDAVFGATGDDADDDQGLVAYDFDDDTIAGELEVQPGSFSVVLAGAAAGASSSSGDSSGEDREITTEEEVRQAIAGLVAQGAVGDEEDTGIGGTVGLGMRGSGQGGGGQAEGLGLGGGIGAKNAKTKSRGEAAPALEPMADPVSASPFAPTPAPTSVTRSPAAPTLSAPPPPPPVSAPTTGVSSSSDVAATSPPPEAPEEAQAEPMPAADEGYLDDFEDVELPQGRSFSSEVMTMAGSSKHAGASHRGGGRSKAAAPSTASYDMPSPDLVPMLEYDERDVMEEEPPPAPPPAPAAGPTRPPRPLPDPRTVPTAVSMDPAVTAAPLSVRPPRAGERLLLEQRLLAPDDSLTITLTWRSCD